MSIDGKLSLRQYLLFTTLEGMQDARTDGKDLGMAEYMLALEAVSSTALAHPEWDLDARQYWHGWEQWIADEKKKK